MRTIMEEQKAIRQLRFIFTLVMLLPIAVMACCLIGLIKDKVKMNNTIEDEAYVSSVKISTGYSGETKIKIYNAIIDYSINDDDISQKYVSKMIIKEGDIIKIHLSPDDYSQIIYGMDKADIAQTIITIFGCLFFIISAKMGYNEMKKQIRINIMQQDQQW